VYGKKDESFGGPWAEMDTEVVRLLSY